MWPRFNLVMRIVSSLIGVAMIGVAQLLWSNMRQRKA